MADIGKNPVQERSVWGLWATLGWVILALLLSQAIGAVVLILLRPDAITGDMDVLLKDGVAVSLSNIPANAVQVIILALASRRPGWSFTEYLGLVRPASRDAAAALWILVIFLLGYDALTYVLGRDIVTPFQVDTYRSAQSAGMLPLFWFALVIAAPVAEEIMFRGFLFRGWVTSERMAIPGILVISALFAAIHVQYDWFGILQVFFIGLLLGLVRWRSGSTTLTILMHVLANLWATVETMIKVEWLS
jgi:membrane protease YdiL (CAAX protease family)